jgi:flagellar hook assembly protein FlgD
VKLITAKQKLTGGLHKLSWNGRNTGNQVVSPGVYYLKVNVNGNNIHKKIVYSK